MQQNSSNYNTHSLKFIKHAVKEGATKIAHEHENRIE